MRVVVWSMISRTPDTCGRSSPQDSRPGNLAASVSCVVCERFQLEEAIASLGISSIFILTLTKGGKQQPGPLQELRPDGLPL